jgi:hypothetical protein
MQISTQRVFDGKKWEEAEVMALKVRFNTNQVVMTIKTLLTYLTAATGTLFSYISGRQGYGLS